MLAAPMDFGREADAYFAWMFDVAGTWHYTDMGGGGGGWGASLDGAAGWDRDASSLRMNGVRWNGTGYVDRLTGDPVSYDEVYNNYIAPKSSTNPQDIIDILNGFNASGGLGPESPNQDNSKITQSNDPCGIDAWVMFPNRLQAELYIKDNSNCDKEKFYYINSDKSVLVGPWNDAYRTEVSPRYLQPFKNGSVIFNQKSYKVDYFVHTHPDHADPSGRDGKVYDYFNYWGIMTLIYYNGHYYNHTHINLGIYSIE